MKRTEPPNHSSVLMAILMVLGLATMARADTTPSNDTTPICADRPGKAVAPCTAPTSHFQIEADVVDKQWVVANGERIDTLTVSATTLKYGLYDRADVELTWTPLTRIYDRHGSTSVIAAGVGDVLASVKWAALSNSFVSVSLLPSIELPTATSGVGGGAVEGGMTIPIALNLPGKLALALSPQFQIMKDSIGDGHHLEIDNVASLSLPVGKYTFTAEVWHGQSWDPAGPASRDSADVAIAYLLRPNLQIDAGFNYSLNRRTSGGQAYMGISHRFD